MNPLNPPPEPRPQNAFESILPRMKEDPACHGQGLRELMKLTLYVLADGSCGHEEGVHNLGDGHQLPHLLQFAQQGAPPFAAVFASEAALEWSLPQMPKELGRVGVLELDATTTMKVLAASKLDCNINHGLTYSLGVGWETAAALAKGTLTESRPNTTPPTGESSYLFQLNQASLPPEFLENVRRFCDTRRQATAVYAFIPAKEGTTPREPDLTKLHLVLRLREYESVFYNDFVLMAARLLPDNLELAVGVATDDTPETLEFLSRSKPIWPVL